ncbi:MAG: hypothetical protein V5A84_05065, partial [Planctomycetota bacterium]
VSLVPMSSIIRLARRDVPEVAELSDTEIARMVRTWAAEQHIALRGGPGAAERPSLSDSELVSRITDAIGDIPTSITIEREHAQVDITASGAEVELREGRVRLAGKIEWGGEMSFTTTYGGLRFSGSLSQEAWKLGVSYRIGPRMPDLTELPNIFSSGWDGMRGLVETVGEVRNLSDIEDASDVISDHFSAAKSALRAIRQISRAEPGTVSFGVGATTSGGIGEEPGPARWQIQATLTIVF